MMEKPVRDTFGRPLQTLRVSVTDRCNLRCNYCMPAEIFGPDFKFLPKSDVLSYEEIRLLVQAFMQIGVRRVRLTGGEPLLRRDLPNLVELLADLEPKLDLSLTTNGVRLKQFLEPLKFAGLQRLNISLDAVDPTIASQMAGRAVDPQRILATARLASEMGFIVKINTVLRPGINEYEAIPLAIECREAGIQLRFIEYMDVGESNGWSRDHVITGSAVLKELSELSPLDPVTNGSPHETARRFTYADNGLEVGFINSISEPFCGGCDRARLSASGHLHTCLFAEQGICIKNWIREEKLSVNAIAERLARHWEKREDRYSELREQGHSGEKRGRPEMWSLGG